MQKRDITVVMSDGKSLQCPPHTSVWELIGEQGMKSDGLPYLGALVNNDVVSLTYPLEVDCELELLTMENPHGWRVYRRSLAFVLAKAVNDVFPEARFSIEHSLGSGLYCNFELHGRNGIETDQLEAIDRRLMELVR